MLSLPSTAAIWSALRAVSSLQQTSEFSPQLGAFFMGPIQVILQP